MQNLIKEALKNPNTKPTVGPRLEGITIGDLISKVAYEFVGPLMK